MVHAQSGAAKGGAARSLAGCGAVLYSASGHTSKVWSGQIGDDGSASTPGLAAGSYYLANSRVPAGYQVRQKDRTFVIGSDGVVTFDDGTKPKPAGGTFTIKMTFFENPPPLMTGDSRQGRRIAATAGAAALVLSAADLAARRMASR